MNKKFDAVKFQRKVREELGKEYAANRTVFFEDLKKKYGAGNKARRKVSAN